MTNYRTIEEVKAANEAAGFYFFEPTAMRFFNSRVCKGVIGGRYFVTSERFEADPRRYTVREIWETGEITTCSTFQQFASARSARAYARGLSV